MIVNIFSHFYSKKTKKIFFKKVKKQILLKNIDSDNITYDDLCNEFGYPSDIIISYFEDQDANYLLKQSHIKKLF